ncbi:spore germination protein [Alkalihalobacterium sp. APHAB7]|uniref:spore germination protein n=1 Tax=Alkalihalobacterium sp. APHAB7 TaxID=3402081 RepID=UPI003AB0EB6B
MFFLNKLKKQPNFNTYDYNEFLTRKIGLEDINHITSDMSSVKDTVTTVFENMDDFFIREIHITEDHVVNFYFFIGLINTSLFQESIIKPITDRSKSDHNINVDSLGDLMNMVQYVEPKDWQELLERCMRGEVICHFSGNKPVTIALGDVETRSLQNPSTEQQVYGPKIGFIEDVHKNMALMRKYFPDPRLKIQKYQAGSVTHTQLALVYLEEYADPAVVRKLQDRLTKIKTDQILTSKMLSQYLVDFPKTPFPLAMKSERPDRVAFSLTQGKVAILINNSTFSLILPISLINFYETGDDNDESSTWSHSFIMFLRIACVVVAAMFPAVYVALVAFHPELIPTTLAMTLAASRNNIPLPAGLEALLMMFALDVLVESSIRLPSFIGQTIGIVGGLVIGQAAVEAGIVSSTMVIVIAFTAIASFTAPSWEIASSWRVVRYVLLIITLLLGLYGLTLIICLLFIHLCALHSVSKPYLSPFAPLNVKEAVNTFFRLNPQARQEEGEANEK